MTRYVCVLIRMSSLCTTTSKKFGRRKSDKTPGGNPIGGFYLSVGMNQGERLFKDGFGFDPQMLF
jgi:hypothetical protein